MPTITINPELCQRDGLCALICQQVFSQGAKGALPRVAHEESCNSCGHCVMLCPSGAISQVDCPPENVHSVRSELMPTYEQVREMLLARRSIRNFQQKSVDEEIIERVIEGARFAPSAKNTQSTRFIVIRDQAMLHAIASLTAGWLGKVSVRLKNPVWRMLYLLAGATDAGEIMRWVGQFELIAKKMEQNTDLVLFGAPVLLLFHGDRTIRFAEANANLALQNATMISFSLGLGSFYTGYVVTACNHGRAIPRLIGLPKGHMVYGGLALGYPKIGFSKWIERNPAPVRWI